MSAHGGTPSSKPASGAKEDARGARRAPTGALRHNGDEGPSSSAEVDPTKLQPTVAWSERDDAVLREEFPHHGPTGAHTKLGHHSLDAIRERALQLGVHERHRPWTPGELECLRLVFARGGAEAVQQKLPARSLEAIRHKAHDLGIRHDRRSATTIPAGEIEEALRQASGNVAQAARALECDAASLRRVATSHGLIFEKDARPHWKVTEIEVVRGEYPKGGASAVQAKLPHRSLHAIYRMAARLGLAGDLKA